MTSISLAEPHNDPPGDKRESERQRLRYWRQELRVLQVAHSSAASRCDRWYRVLAVLVAVTTTVVGTAIFTTLNESPSEEVKALASVTSVLAVVIGAAQSALDLGRRSESHLMASTHYDELLHLVEGWRVEHPSDVKPADSDIGKWMKRWTAAEAQAPPIPEKRHRHAIKLLNRRDHLSPVDAASW